VPGLAHAHLGGDLPHDLVGRGVDRVLDHAQHPLGLVVVGGELGLPVGDAHPLRVAVEGPQGPVERVGVDERAAADAGPRKDHDVVEQGHPLDAPEAQLGRPQVAAQLPVGLRQRLAGEPAAGLDDPDRPALLGEAQGGDAAAEPAADDHDVVVPGTVGRVRPLDCGIHPVGSGHRASL
jgi:hypothetical protein